MPLSTIVCLDDLTRPDTWPHSELVFDLVRLPIFHASGLNIGRTPHRGHQMNLSPGFALARFRQLCEVDGILPPWHQLHHAVPDAAADYLLAHLPTDALVLGHAMPPWLLQLLAQAERPYIDLRTSPLRFGSDLIMGLRTNQPAVHAAAQGMAMTADEVLAESNLMAARLRMHRRSEGRLRLPPNPCVFVGQVEDDPALLGADGRFARAIDHAEILGQLARTGPMMYLPHPRAGDFARIERDAIERVLGRAVPVCEVDTYDLLACDDELMLLGLNGEALQEAAWFARPAYALCPLPNRPVFSADDTNAGWLQLAPHTLMGERLWAGVLGKAPRARTCEPVPRPDLLRELLNDWWGYADATLRGNAYQREAFAHAGGQRQADALRRCEADLASTHDRMAALAGEIERLKALVDRQARQAQPADAADVPHAAGARGRRNTSPAAPRKASVA
jgi:hypothetical protein